MSLVDNLRARDRSLNFVPAGSDGAGELARHEGATAMIWAAGAGPEGPGPLILAAADAGAPVVVLLHSFSLNGVDAARGNIELSFPPFNPEEVLLRIRIARGRAAGPHASNVIRHGELSIDRDRYEVMLSGRKVDLTYKEYELLKFLASNPSRVFSREALLRSVWEYDYFGGTRTVDVHVRRLRSKIDDVRNRFIETVWNVGYRFRPPDDSSDAT